MEWSGGRWGQRQPGVGGEGEGRLYHDTICQEFSFNSQSFLMGFGVFWRLKSTSAKSNTISDCFPNWVPHMFISPPHHTTQPSSPNQYLWCLVAPPSVADPFDIKSDKIQTNKEPRDEEST